MGLNVSTSMGFENMDMLKNAAKNILNKNGSNPEASAKFVEQTLFSETSGNYVNPQLAIMKASLQITSNASLNETLKYLKSQTFKKAKKNPVLGEIWSMFEENNENSEQKEYTGELIDFQIDENIKNIFAA